MVFSILVKQINVDGAKTVEQRGCWGRKSIEKFLRGMCDESNINAFSLAQETDDVFGTL
jgi:hypothetical protein